jgi:acyl carrier protein
MNPQELYDLIGESLEIDASAIHADKAISDYEEWNSLAWLTIMSLLDERYGISLSGAEIRSFKSVQDFVDNVTGKVSAV